MIFKIKEVFKKFKTHFHLVVIKFIGILAVFISFKLINLITDEYVLGVFSIIIVYMNIIARVINFGLPTYALKQISKNRDNFSETEVEKFYSNTLGTIVTNSLLCGLGLIFLTLICSKWIFAKFSYMDIGVLSLMAPFFAIISYNAQILRAKQMFFKFQLLSGALIYGLFCLMLLLAYVINLRDLNVPLVFLLCLCLVAIYSFVGIKINFNVVAGRSFISFKNHLNNIKKGLDYLIVQLSSQGLNWITLIFTSYFIGEIDTGGLNIIIRLAALCGFFKTIINSIKGPDYAYLYHSNKLDQLNNEIKYNSKILVYFSLPLITILFIFPEFFLNIFSENYGHLKTVFRIILLGAFIDNFFGSVGLLMQMTKEEKNFKNIMIVSLLMHAIFGFTLVYYLEVRGVALSLLIAALFWNIFSAVLLKRRYNIKSYITY